jgi:hypothetical protein
MEVGVADAARRDLYEHLARARLRDRHLLDPERLVERADDGGAHGGWHKFPSSI